MIFSQKIVFFSPGLLCGHRALRLTTFQGLSAFQENGLGLDLGGLDQEVFLRKKHFSEKVYVFNASILVCIEGAVVSH